MSAFERLICRADAIIERKVFGESTLTDGASTKPVIGGFHREYAEVPSGQNEFTTEIAWFDCRSQQIEWANTDSVGLTMKLTHKGENFLVMEIRDLDNGMLRLVLQ